MPIDDSEIINLLIRLSDEEELSLTITEAKKGAAAAGAGAFFGALLAGPAGIAIGGALGGMIGYSQAKDFKPLTEVIKDLSSEEQKKLSKRVISIISSRMVWITARNLVQEVNSNTAVRQLLIEALKKYFGL